MPRPYEAQLGGIEGSGVYGKPNVAPDWAAIAQAISGGASSLLQGAYTRKMGQARLALDQRRLDQEHELHLATLAATNEWRKTQAALSAERIGAPGARATQQQKDAFTTLQKEDPQNDLVKPNDDGTPAEFDPNANYVLPLSTVLRAKSASAAEAAKHADALDTLSKSGQLRASLQKSGILLRAGATGSKPLTPAQSQAKDAKDKATLLTEIGTLSGGDPVKAHDIIANDPDIASAVDRLKIGNFEVEAAAKAYGTKNAGSTSTSTQTIEGANTKTTTVRGKTPAGAAPPPTDTLPSWMTPGAPAGPITPLAVPGQVKLPAMPPGPVPQAGWPATPQGAAAAAQARPITPLQVPGASATAAPPATPPAIPKLNMGPVPATGTTPPAGAPPGAPPIKPIDERTLSDAALWEVKRIHGLSPADSTAYVKARQTAALPVASSVSSDAEETEPAPTGV